MNFKIPNNKIEVNTIKIKKSILKPKRNNSNPTTVGINTINPDKSKLLAKMIFLIKF
jgi:hypothetical protein